MKRITAFLAALSVSVSVFAGCAAPAGAPETTHEAAAVSTAAPKGVYQIENSKDYTFVRMQDGEYGLWKAGDKCNKDFSKAPASCVVTGTYEISEDGTEITFKDDATGKTTTAAYSVKTVGFRVDTTASVKTTGAQKGGDDSSKSGDESKSGDDQKPVATALNLSKCFQAAMLACQLMFPDPKLTGPETIPEIKIERPIGIRPTAQG